MEDFQKGNNPKNVSGDEDTSLIYHNYSGLSGEIESLDEVSSSDGKNKPEIQKIRSKIEKLENKEEAEEKQKTSLLLGKFKDLNDQKQKQIVFNHKSAEKIISHYIEGEKDIDGLDEEERFILNKIKNQYKDFRKKHTEDSFQFDLASELDKLVYSNLIYDIAFKLSGEESPIKRENDQLAEIDPGEKLENKTREAGIAKQPIKNKKFISVVAEEDTGALEIDESAKFLTIEYLKKKKNSLTERKAKEVINLVKDWINYDRDFYCHLTGRALKLRPGVDYGEDEAGSEDNFLAARNKKIEEWLKLPSNRTWIAQANEFQKQNIDKISLKKEKVKIADQKQKIREEERYATPFFIENNWFCYESNYFDSYTQSMTQKNREESKYRIYFYTQKENIIGTFRDLVLKFSRNEDFDDCGFAAKTIAIFNPKADNLALFMNQKDQIILSFGEKGIDRALLILQEYVQKNRAKFEEKGILLGQKFFDRSGKEVPGICISSETMGVSPDASRGFPKYRSFNQMQSEIILASLSSVFKEIYSFDNLDRIGLKNPRLKQKLLEMGHEAPLEDYLYLFFSQPSGDSFLIRNLEKVYPRWSRAFGMSRNNIAFKDE
jgi:hypothetical protein